MTDETPYFDAHIFCCTNRRQPGHARGSCAERGSEDLRDYMKSRCKEMGLGKRVRVNVAGCLDRCELGPVMVIYPQGVWYHYETEADVDEIITRHLLGGAVVERLALRNGQKRLDR